MRSSNLRIALAQCAPKLGDVGRNLELHAELIDKARAAEAELLVFPELSLTGYFLRDMVPDVAVRADCAEIAGLITAAGSMDLVAGFVEQSPELRYYNAAFYAHDGKLSHVHRKVYLPTYGLFDEQRYFAAGDRIRAFEVPELGRVGLLVCEDLWHLSCVTILQAYDIDVLIGVSNSPARGVDGPRIRTAETYERMVRMYAELLGVLVIFVNRVGFEDGLCFWGGSMVADPGGGLLATSPMLDPDLTIVDFDFAELRRKRIASPLSRDERPLLTLEELEHVKRVRYGG